MTLRNRFILAVAVAVLAAPPASANVVAASRASRGAVSAPVPAVFQAPTSLAPSLGAPTLGPVLASRLSAPSLPAVAIAAGAARAAFPTAPARAAGVSGAPAASPSQGPAAPAAAPRSTAAELVRVSGDLAATRSPRDAGTVLHGLFEGRRTASAADAVLSERGVSSIQSTSASAVRLGRAPTAGAASAKRPVPLPPIKPAGRGSRTLTAPRANGLPLGLGGALLLAAGTLLLAAGSPAPLAFSAAVASFLVVLDAFAARVLAPARELQLIGGAAALGLSLASLLAWVHALATGGGPAWLALGLSLAYGAHAVAQFIARDRTPCASRTCGI